MNKWMHTVRLHLPPIWFLVALILLMAVSELCLFIFTSVHQFLSEDLQPILQVRLLVTHALAVLLAVHRTSYNNPACNESYRQWLKTTPWAPGMRLPCGALTWGVRDLVAVTLLILSAYVFARPWWGFAVTYLVVYYLSMAGIMWSVGVRWEAYAIVVVVVLIPALTLNNEFFWVPLLSIYAAVYRGVQRMLSRFPWDDELRWRPGQTAKSHPKLGWPYDSFFYTSEDVRLRWVDKLMVSIICGGAVFSAIILIENQFGPVRRAVSGLPVLFGFVVCAIRLSIYLRGTAPPISLFGRLATGRLIVPRYDQVFVVPLALMVFIVVLGELFKHIGASVAFSYAAIITVAMMFVMAGPPSLDRWRLTGSYRQYFSTDSKRDFVQFGSSQVAFDVQQNDD